MYNYDPYDTKLSPKELIGFYMSKLNSPFKDDSGYDYDLKGFWKKYGTLQPTATNGHLTDEFKKPNHPTFSKESRYYNGQPHAVDWNNTLMKALAERGYL